MKIIKNMENFLKDQDYYLDIFKNYFHIYSYKELLALTSTLIEVKMANFILVIEGQDLVVKNMDKCELLISGSIDTVRFKR